MWTLVFLLCDYAAGSCLPVAREEVFRDREVCVERALNIRDAIYEEAEERGAEGLVLYKCIEWGEPA